MIRLTKEDTVSRVLVGGSMSLDGFIARSDDSVGPLFDWYGNGDVEIAPGDPERSFHLTRASAEHLATTWSRIGAGVIGRRLFDLTDGWKGRPAVGDAVVVVTSRPVDDWPYPDAPFHFVDRFERAVELARELAGGRDVSVSAGNLCGQALAAGIVDEIHIDLVPMVLGSGVRFFGDFDGPEFRFGDPEVVQGARVTHLAYRRD